jgi:hypothetical protein
VHRYRTSIRDTLQSACYVVHVLPDENAAEEFDSHGDGHSGMYGYHSWSMTPDVYQELLDRKASGVSPLPTLFIIHGHEIDPEIAEQLIAGNSRILTLDTSCAPLEEAKTFDVDELRASPSMRCYPNEYGRFVCRLMEALELSSPFREIAEKYGG